MRLSLAQQSSQGCCLVCCRALCNSTPLSSSQLPMAVIDTALCQQPDCLPLLEKSVRSLSCVCSWLLNWVYQISRYTGYQRLPDLWATDCMFGDTQETLVRNTPNNIWNNILLFCGDHPPAGAQLRADYAGEHTQVHIDQKDGDNGLLEGKLQAREADFRKRGKAQLVLLVLLQVLDILSHTSNKPITAESSGIL